MTNKTITNAIITAAIGTVVSLVIAHYWNKAQSRKEALNTGGTIGGAIGATTGANIPNASIVAPGVIDAINNFNTNPRKR